MVQVSQDGTCVSLHNSSDSSSVGQPVQAVSCAFDRVFGPDSTQQEIFQGLLPALDTILQGFNASVLAYGQTGSGKTHTLIGTHQEVDRSRFQLFDAVLTSMFSFS